MGRPLKKDVFGTTVLGNYRNGNSGIRVSGYFGGALNTDYILVKQRGAQTFVVARLVTMTGDVANGSPTISNVSSFTSVDVGEEIAGTGIPTGAVIAAYDSTAATITLNVNATATNTGVTLYHTGAYVTGTTVDTTPNANGEILIQGYNTAGTGQGAQVTANLVSIRKLTRRLAYGFPSSPVLNALGFQNSENSNAATNHDEVKYTWFLNNDSSADYISLTPVLTVM